MAVNGRRAAASDRRAPAPSRQASSRQAPAAARQASAGQASARQATGGRRLVVNPIACDAHGICAELLPELIRLDEWGYPVIDDRPIPHHLEALARRAVSACPTLALLIRDVPVEAPRKRS